MSLINELIKEHARLFIFQKISTILSVFHVINENKDNNEWDKQRWIAISFVIYHLLENIIM